MREKTGHSLTLLSARSLEGNFFLLREPQQRCAMAHYFPLSPSEPGPVSWLHL